MSRWMMLDNKLVNLDRLTSVEPHQIRAEGPEPPVMGAWISLGHADCYIITRKSVEEVYRLIECAEGPEPPKARE